MLYNRDIIFLSDNLSETPSELNKCIFWSVNCIEMYKSYKEVKTQLLAWDYGKSLNKLWTYEFIFEPLRVLHLGSIEVVQISRHLQNNIYIPPQ